MNQSVKIKLGRNKSIGYSFFLYLSFLVVFSIQIKAQGNLSVTPRRAIFEGQKRIIELSLSNISQDSAKYAISFVQIRMTEDGGMQKIATPNPGERFADKYIRVFPRSVKLGPNETQIVRLQLNRTEQLESGEYRSHLYFKSLIPQKALGAEDFKKDSNVLLKLEITFGITMPVIIRVGESTTMLNIDNVRIVTNTDGSKKLSLNINRTGNMSVYGEVSAMYVSPSGKVTQIGLLKDVAVYTPNLLLKVNVDLNNIQNIDLTKGKIRVVYFSKSGMRTEKFAEAELVL